MHPVGAIRDVRTREGQKTDGSNKGCRSMVGTGRHRGGWVTLGWGAAGEEKWVGVGPPG